MKIKRCESLRGVPYGWRHWCPGCECNHVIPDRWLFDGNLEAPSFAPSVNINHGECHYFISAGMIEFCGDSKHALAGQTVPMPALESLDEHDW